MTEKRRPETIAAQVDGHIEPSHFGLSPAIYPSSTYERATDLTLPGGAEYSRDGNPTYLPAEATLMALEGGRDAVLVASGMAAATSVVQALEPGSTIVATKVMYWAFRNWLLTDAARMGYRVVLVDNGTANIVAAIEAEAPQLVWVETPANPTWRLTDIAAVAAASKKAGAVLTVDSTCASPILTRPLDLGADIVMHSATKYLSGHSDVVAGALVVRTTELPIWQNIRRVRAMGGSVIGPFEAWLVQRGMRTLHLRVERACQNALALAEHFADAPNVREVMYPGLPDHPDHDLAVRQMTGGFGGMMSICTGGGGDRARLVMSRLKVLKRATSLGGVESLAEHRAPVEGPDTPAPDDMLRISVGVEAVEDLIADLEQALGQ